MLVLVMSPAFADSPIRSQGRGLTLEDAKNNAFASAIEIKVGSAVVSEQESVNDKVRDDILNYSAGYVDRYEIVKKSQTDKGFYVIVDVWVSPSKIQNRILGASVKPAKLEGDRVATQYQTYLQQKQKGDKLMQMVMNAFPSKAFVATVGPHRLKVDINRNAVLEIPIEMRWNYNYIAALNEALGVLQDKSNGFLIPSPANAIVMAKDPKDFLLGTKNHYKFNDVVMLDSLRNTFNAREPRMLVELIGADNQVVVAECFVARGIASDKAPPFYTTHNFLMVYGNTVEKNTVSLVFDQSTSHLLTQSFKIQASVVSNEKCH